MGCRRKAPAQELFRVVVGPTGDLVPGAGLPGRGAWLCDRSAACLDAAIKRKAFSRALRTAVPAAAAEALRAVFEGREAPMCEDVGPQPSGGTINSPERQPGSKAAKD